MIYVTRNVQKQKILERQLHLLRLLFSSSLSPVILELAS